MDDITKKLQMYAELKAQRDVVQLHYADLRKEIIPKEIQDQLDDVSAEEGMTLESLDFSIQELEKEIKDDVVALGATVKAGNVQAIFTKPRITWDTKALEVYATMHPELERYKKVGQPYTVIKFV